MKIKTKDNFILDVRFTTIENSDKAVIFAHGITVDKNDEGIFVRSEKILNSLGFSTIIFDFRGHGKSTGNSSQDVTISGEITDLKTIYNFVIGNKIRNIGLAGASFGGGIASLFCGKFPNKIKCLFLANPVLDYQTWIYKPVNNWQKEYFGNLKNKLKDKGFITIGSKKFKIGLKLFAEVKKNKPYKALNKYINPLLIIHSQDDDIVPFDVIYNVYHKLNNKQKRFIPIKGSGHGFDEEPYETKVVDVLVDFFKSNL